MTYKVAWERRRYPPKAILGTAYEFATGKRLGSSLITSTARVKERRK